MSNSRLDPDDAVHFYALADSDCQGEKNEQTLLHYRAHIGRAHELYLREASLVYEALRPLIASLQSGRLTPAMRTLLADFLMGILNRDDAELGLRVLGRETKKQGAPRQDKEVLWWEAHSNYEHWIEEGHSDEEALRVAWETFYPDRDFNIESTRPLGRSTAYVQQIEKIKSALNTRGSRVPGRKGRKPK